MTQAPEGTSGRSRSLAVGIELAALFLVLAAALLFRLDHLRTSPGWYVDEGDFMNAAQNILHARWDQMTRSGLPLELDRPPLFFFLLAGMFRLFGEDILVLRAMAVGIGMLVILATYLACRQVLGKPTAWLAAALLAILPEVIYHNRIGFTYNLLALFFVLAAWGAWNYLEGGRPRWLVFAALAAGLAVISDYVGALALLVVGLAVLVRRPRDIWRMALVSLLPAALILSLMVLLSPGSAWSDIRYSLVAGLSGTSAGNLAQKLARLMGFYGEMVRQQGWAMLGLVGLFLLPDPRFSKILAGMGFGLILLHSFARLVVGQYLLPVWPLFAIGLAGLLARGVPYILGTVKKDTRGFVQRLLGNGYRAGQTGELAGSLASVLSVFALVAVPLVWLLANDLVTFVAEQKSPQELVSHTFDAGYLSPQDAEPVIAYLSAHISPDDQVLAPPNVAWALPARVTLVNIVNFEHGRLAGAQSLVDFKYAVVDDSFRFFASSGIPNKPLGPEIAQPAFTAVTAWPLVLTQGSLQVYCNPSLCAR